MRYGFAIDQRTCIGCHACTVACKVEHKVPVGQFRTWVKYVDSGTFPDATRDFAVLRCNHCTDAPCVAICPTNALFKRPDGIVDFDSDLCIGCKSCLQACPYDAIYIDAETHTAAKCNFCAHRVDNGLEPACVTVCPTHSIWVGDLDDPASGISQLVAANDTKVRAPEHLTGPNVHYVGAAPATLDPLAAPVRGSYVWAEPDDLRLATSGDFLDADPMTATTLNTAHPVAWGWRVAAYLWTKGVAAGALIVAAVGILLGLARVGPIAAGPGVAVVGTALTGALLVWDLKRPERFYFLLTRANQGSWLVRGGYCLMALAAVSGVWVIGQLVGVDARVFDVTMAVLAIPAGLMGAGYTAWLFGQAEGRDLWQSELLLPHLVTQAFMAGAGMVALLTCWSAADPGPAALAARVLVVATAVQAVIGVVELTRPHRSRNAAQAAAILVRGRYARLYWVGCVGLSLVVVALGLVGWAGGSSSQVSTAVGGLVAQVAVLLFEALYVRAGQEVPLS